MKNKIFSIVFVIILMFSLSACGSNSSEVDEISDKEKFPDFELEDLDGNVITSEIFSENKVTLVNLWGTFCTPCIREMPELDKLYKEMSEDGFNVVGIVTDGNVEIAKEIIDALVISYDQIIPTDEFTKEYLVNFEYAPTTIFVNSKGEIIGELILGARTYEEFKEISEKLLKEES